MLHRETRDIEKERQREAETNTETQGKTERFCRNVKHRHKVCLVKKLWCEVASEYAGLTWLKYVAFRKCSGKCRCPKVRPSRVDKHRVQDVCHGMRKEKHTGTLRN